MGGDSFSQKTVPGARISTETRAIATLGLLRPGLGPQQAPANCEPTHRARARAANKRARLPSQEGQRQSPLGVWANRREKPAEKQVGGVAWQDEELEVALHCGMRLPMSMLHDKEHVDADGKAGACTSGTKALSSPLLARRRLGADGLARCA